MHSAYCLPFVSPPLRSGYCPVRCLLPSAYCLPFLRPPSRSGYCPDSLPTAHCLTHPLPQVVLTRVRCLLPTADCRLPPACCLLRQRRPRLLHSLHLTRRLARPEQQSAAASPPAAAPSP